MGDRTCARGEPTKSVVTAILVQPATASDHGSAPATLAEHAAAAGPGRSPPDEVFVDAGYVSAPALLRAQADGYELVGPAPTPPHGGDRFGTDSFEVDLPARKAICPAGNASSECDRIDDAKYGLRYYFAWPAKACAACPLRARCVSKKNTLARRTIEVTGNHMILQERRNLCRTPGYCDRMHRRSAIEGTHSELARGYGLRRCRYKGCAKTSLQAQLTVTACNLRRWARRLCWEEPRKRKWTERKAQRKPQRRQKPARRPNSRKNDTSLDPARWKSQNDCRQKMRLGGSRLLSAADFFSATDIRQIRLGAIGLVIYGYSPPSTITILTGRPSPAVARPPAPAPSATAPVT